MEVVAGLSLKNMRPRVWDPGSPDHVPRLGALRDRFSRQLCEAVAGRRFRAADVNLGRLYRRALPDLGELLAPIPVEDAVGGIGVRNARTRGWVLGQLGEAEGPAISGGTAGPRSRRR